LLKNNSIKHSYKKFKGLLLTRNSLVRYSLPQTILKQGKLRFEDYKSLQKFVVDLNKQIQAEAANPVTPTTGELNGLLIINTALQLVLEKVTEKTKYSSPEAMAKYLVKKLGKAHFQKAADKINHTYLLPEDSVSPFTKEIIINYLLGNNPALAHYHGLISTKKLNHDSAFKNYISALQEFLQTIPVQNKNTDLISFLQKPVELHPFSLLDQLKYIRDNWSDFLGDFLTSLLTGLDLLKEEQKFWLAGPGETPIYNFQLSNEEYEKFSQDSDWMPHLVLIAKSTYVWLDQLSKKYERSIQRFDQIPDQELQILAERGFTGLWFIGVWQRSQASRKIKHISGNDNVIASAYSLADYRIADELGGNDAMVNLQHRAGRYGIRIACDMVPNHMGIDSDWIIDHPDWFLQLPYPPFPSYSFNGENLSSRPEIEVYIEDHYYEKTDAAVVYKMFDRRDHQNRYIYHGNDGTGIPWNDTAQLNYLLPEVREAVIQNIIRIARQFPIIRFDAAMTLAKKHIHRLWFPEPGAGGDIASRSNFGLTHQEFNQLMPQEFWREVVDRVAAEAPNTLLLAEAFWMMEGYFVRTLGMHRVYNSAFMNMLKNEENAKYRQSIYNIIEFNPEILKRFVNFMSNPDEDTAVAQFGKDDKYFGVCILMITMPGLPMFAHGQIEGFTERYGMEFPKARWEESEDEYLVKRHQREIFPLIKKRIIFSEVENFLLFDFQTESGNVDENVFAYFNQNLGERSLVIYNNKFQNTSGKIQWANTVIRENDKPVWIRKSLSNALNIPRKNDHYLIFRDQIKDLDYIRNCSEIHDYGLFQELGAFKYCVLINFREVQDTDDKKYAKLSEYLQGGGVPDIEISLKKLSYHNLYESFHEACGTEILKKILEFFSKPEDLKLFLPEFKYRLQNFLNELTLITFRTNDQDLIVRNICLDISKWISFSDRKQEYNVFEKIITFYWIIFKNFFTSHNNVDKILFELVSEYMLADEICNAVKPFGLKLDQNDLISLLIVLTSEKSIFSARTSRTILTKIKTLLKDQNVQNYIGLNEFDEIIWFNREKLEQLLDVLLEVDLLKLVLSKKTKPADLKKAVKLCAVVKLRLHTALQESDYKLEKFLTSLT